MNLVSQKIICFSVPSRGEESFGTLKNGTGYKFH